MCPAPLIKRAALWSVCDRHADGETEALDETPQAATSRRVKVILLRFCISRKIFKIL